MEVKYCSLCPYGKIKGPIWDKDLEEDVHEITCNMLHEVVYENMSWSELASKSASGEGWDTPPNGLIKCPFRDEAEKPEDVIKPSSLI